MRKYGVNYDTGLTIDGRSTRSAFDSEVARRELRIIAADLHATAVRVSGDDLDRLTTAAAHALDAGLEVWFSPFPYDLEPDALAARPVPHPCRGFRRRPALLHRRSARRPGGTPADDPP